MIGAGHHLFSMGFFFSPLYIKIEVFLCMCPCLSVYALGVQVPSSPGQHTERLCLGHLRYGLDFCHFLSTHTWLSPQRGRLANAQEKGTQTFQRISWNLSLHLGPKTPFFKGIWQPWKGWRGRELWSFSTVYFQVLLPCAWLKRRLFSQELLQPSSLLRWDPHRHTLPFPVRAQLLPWWVLGPPLGIRMS